MTGSSYSGAPALGVCETWANRSLAVDFADNGGYDGCPTHSRFSNEWEEGRSKPRHRPPRQRKHPMSRKPRDPGHPVVFEYESGRSTRTVGFRWDRTVLP